MSKPQNIEQRLRAVREKLALSQSALAERIRFSRNYISMVENGRDPGPKFLKALENLEVVAKLRPIPTSEQEKGARMLTEEAGESYGPRGRLRSAREAAGLTPEQLAKKSGTQASYIRNLEGGGVRIVEGVARKLAKALPGLEVEELLAGSEAAREIDVSGITGTYGAEPNIDFPEGTRVRYAPLLSRAQAGQFSGTWTDEGYEHTGVIAVDLPRGAKPFAIQVEGNSMSPDIKEGDYAIVLSGQAPRQGDEVIVCLEDGEVMCKVYHSSGDKITLSSYNPAHPPIERRREEIRWVFPIDHTIRKRRRT